MSAKVRIKVGPLEFEYEGETEFSMSHFKELFSHIEVLLTMPSSGWCNKEQGGEESDASISTSEDKTSTTKLHINGIAQKLDVKSGPDLAVAAAAYLQLNVGKESFSRQELLSTMKMAKKYYKSSMSGNLTKSLNTLVGSKLNEVGAEQYSLTADTHDDLEKLLA